jgi:hypothetical protein
MGKAVTVLHGAPITSIGMVPIGTILRSDVGTRIAGLLLPRVTRAKEVDHKELFLLRSVASLRRDR